MLNLLVWTAACLGSIAILGLSVWEWHDVDDAVTGLKVGIIALLAGAVAGAVYYGARHDRWRWPLPFLGVAALVVTMAGEYAVVWVERITTYSPTLRKTELCTRDHHGTLTCVVALDNR